VNGEINVTPETDFPERFVGLEEIYVRDRQRWEKFSIVSSRLVSGRPVLHLKEITTPEQAARLTNRELAVLRSQLVALPDDTYFIFDLIGCEIIEEGSGRQVGHVAHVERCPANDVYVIEAESGKVVRCPVVRKFVKKVDVKEKRITVDTAGWLEEDDA
jgi:16S rRNA processing protein RimM